MAFKPLYFAKRFGYNLLPKIYFKNRFKKLMEYQKVCDNNELNSRLNYYFKLNDSFEFCTDVFKKQKSKDIPKSVKVKDFVLDGSTDYYLDMKEYFNFFNKKAQFSYIFGDDIEDYDYPFLKKARKIDSNENSILLKLNKIRHFKWSNDKTSFLDKKNMIVWRGGTTQEHRKEVVKKFYDNKLCDIGQFARKPKGLPWQKGFLSIKEQLKYKFILSIEGNDVATNLKWILSSNSLCFMVKPTCETWFMEGALVGGKHFVEIKNDYTDLEEKVLYYINHPDEAQNIINNAHKHVKRFLNPKMEEILCFKVLEKFCLLSKQRDFVRF